MGGEEGKWFGSVVRHWYLLTAVRKASNRVPIPASSFNFFQIRCWYQGIQCEPRVELEVTVHRAMACCLMFPADYPAAPILVELKSRTLAPRLLAGLTRLAEQEAGKHLGKPQVQAVPASYWSVLNPQRSIFIFIIRSGSGSLFL